MRLFWILLLVTFLPQRISWRAGDDDCCGDSCQCSSVEGPSCCKKSEGPVVVALCSCGESHERGVVEHAPFDWYCAVAEWTAFSVPAEAWLDPAPGRIPLGNVVAPEPPPPRVGCSDA